MEVDDPESHQSELLTRVKVDVKDTSDFSGDKIFTHQYNEMYTLRHKVLKPVLLDQVKSKWSGEDPFIHPSDACLPACLSPKTLG